MISLSLNTPPPGHEALFVTPTTSILRSVNSLSLGHNLGSPYEFLLMCTEVLFVDAHSVHHFIDELSPTAVLSPLPVGSSINQSMEDIDEGIEEELALFAEQYNENLVKDFYANLFEEFGNPESPAYGQVYVRGHVIDFSPANIARYLSCPLFSDIKGTGLKEEVDFNELPTTNVTAVLKERAHLLYTFAIRKRINICTVIFKNILRKIDQKKANNIALSCPCLISEYLLGCKDLSLLSDFWARGTRSSGDAKDTPTPST
ncbi:hypothetical protein M9H77_13144 [Catharanthus roseus]|uniref:Uncharacterized protein n=1 Tax=Catharanthus roseus TaxID=4058 RepID=A0ACC0BJH0_CATRO|nr:hypothetical protein M9H77_13144 [Catharanthus roseus]